MTQRLNYADVAPEGLGALAHVRAYVAGCGLPTGLIDLVYLRISQINGCAYCIDLHTRDLLKNGTALDKIVLVAVWHEADDLFSIQERAALAWAETVTLVHRTGVPDAAFADVARAFTEKELADLTIAIGLMNSYNRLAISFRTPPRAARHAVADASGLP